MSPDALGDVFEVRWRAAVINLSVFERDQTVEGRNVVYEERRRHASCVVRACPFLTAARIRTRNTPPDPSAPRRALSLTPVLNEVDLLEGLR